MPARRSSPRVMLVRLVQTRRTISASACVTMAMRGRERMRRQRNEEAEQCRQHTGDHIVNHGPDAELHAHQGRTVRPQAEERLMAEREDAGIAVDQIPTRSERSEEEGEDEDVEQVRLARQRRNGQKKCGGKPGDIDAGSISSRLNHRNAMPKRVRRRKYHMISVVAAARHSQAFENIGLVTPVTGNPLCPHLGTRPP
jgi:hypothetical protein